MYDESTLPETTYLSLEEVFSPIFFYYPNKLKDHSVWTPRKTREYICQWHRYAEMRTWVRQDADATEHGIKFSKEEILRIKIRFQEEELMTEKHLHTSPPWHPRALF